MNRFKFLITNFQCKILLIGCHELQDNSTNRYVTTIELPSEIWNIILIYVSQDIGGHHYHACLETTDCEYITLAFVSQVSKEINSLCDKVKRQLGIQLTKVDAFQFQQYFASRGYLSCMSYAHENGCKWNENTCLLAAYNGHLECLKYAYENGCLWDWNSTCCNAASNGYLEVLKYAHENGCEWEEGTCEYAAKNGHLEMLQYAHKNGCDWTEWTCSFAAENGHLEVLKYAHENGCRWNKNTCISAAMNGHLKVLKYAHENGCPWNSDTCSAAAFNGNLECLKYAHEHGCPRHRDTCLFAAPDRGHIDYLNKQECQCDSTPNWIKWVDEDGGIIDSTCLICNITK